MESAYEPEKYEDNIYRLWEESGYFAPENAQPWVEDAEAREPWSMVLPPPNVTGVLHIGHALTVALEDSIARYQRMQGKKTLWLPGTDHAAIATQSKVEKLLNNKEEKTRHDLGREAFLQRVEQFAKESHDTIVNQLKKMGCSLDWTREAYTLDEQRENAVFAAFKQMYEDGLIYRGHRVVNWDPVGQTTVSDDEVERTEEEGTLYTFRYEKDFPIPIATTRPETKLGDTAIAVHPDDERYQEYVGQVFEVIFAGMPLEIQVIADEAIDPTFGTGAVGVTPAHSAIDWELSQKHGLPLKQVINEQGQIEGVSADFDGKSVAEARTAVVEWLTQNNLLENTETITHNVGRAERTGAIVEPLPKLQWWVSVEKLIAKRDNKTLKDLMREAVESGEIEIIPERFKKIYFHWIENLRDWNISRQIWYGHRIPVYYCTQGNQESRLRQGSGGQAGIRNQEMVVAEEKPETCPICGACNMEQDPDTLDTWFSSGLWTFSTLGWPSSLPTPRLRQAGAKATGGGPEKTDDLATFHPTSVLETGHDILFFWVARMVLMSTYLLGEIPFKTVYLHGLVRDEKGDKMSKSAGNSIDPLEKTKEFGTDALRMALIVGNAPGTDVGLGDEKIIAYQRFANKVWNAARFASMNLEDYDPAQPVSYTAQDTQRLEELAASVKEITQEIDDYHLHIAAEKIYHYFWHAFADEIIEETKSRLYPADEVDADSRRAAQSLVATVLTASLRMLHPFMPFVTEALWQELPFTDGLLMVAEWPDKEKLLSY